MIMCDLLCYPVSIHMSQLLSTGRPISSLYYYLFTDCNICFLYIALLCHTIYIYIVLCMISTV